MIPALKISSVEYPAIVNVLIECNSQILRLKVLLGIKTVQELRKKLNPISLKAFKDDNLSFQLKREVAIALPAIHAAKQLETRMIQAFSRLAMKIAIKTSSYSNIPVEDCYAENLIAILDAMYTYNGSSKLVTYIYHVMKNRMRSLLKKNTLLSHLTNESIRLQKEFNLMRDSINGPASEEMVFQKLNWTQKEKLNYWSSKTTCILDSSIKTPETEEETEDYTSFRKTFKEEEKELDLQDFLEKANLSPLEQEIVKNYANPSVGWMTNLAKKYKSPQTGRCYTKAAISAMAKRVLSKLKAMYQRKAA